VLLGYRGWLRAWGIDYGDVERDVRSMLAAQPGTPDLMLKYGVDFVVVGPTERTDYGADEAYWLAHHELVLESGPYKVFAIEPNGRRNTPARREQPAESGASPGR
jgi:uncharacterized membrane protein